MNIIANAIDAIDESNAGRIFADIQVKPNQKLSKINNNTCHKNEIVGGL